jgi:transcriptional regulator with XRE-family HTH domain
MINTTDYYQVFRSSFANRLINKLQEKGYISKHGVCGVNGTQLAQAIGVSLPMVRRYINAKSIPTNVTLQKIAIWLDTDPYWLLYGSSTTNFSQEEIDNKLFQEIFMQLYPLLCNVSLPKEQYKVIINKAIYIYNYVFPMKEGQPKDKAILLMVDFLKKNIRTRTVEIA